MPVFELVTSVGDIMDTYNGSKVDAILRAQHLANTKKKSVMVLDEHGSRVVLVANWGRF